MKSRFNRSLLRALAISAASYSPIYGRVIRRRAKVNDSHNYFLGVWLNHLAAARRGGVDPTTVVELGPGSLLACGVFALLTGVRSYVAIETVELTAEALNTRFLDELPSLLRQGKLDATLARYRLSRNVIEDSLNKPEMIGRLRNALEEAFRGRPARDAPIRFLSPAQAHKEILSGETDLVFSQAVLEHVNTLSQVIDSCGRMIGTRGVMSHRVDLRCHRTHDAWNGHWTYSSLLWRALQGRRPYLINREPAETYRRLLSVERGFELLEFERSEAPNSLDRAQLDREFRGLSDIDLSTSALDLLARSANTSLLG